MPNPTKLDLPKMLQDLPSRPAEPSDYAPALVREIEQTVKTVHHTAGAGGSAPNANPTRLDLIADDQAELSYAQAMEQGRALEALAKSVEHNAKNPETWTPEQFAALMHAWAKQHKGRNNEHN